MNEEDVTPWDEDDDPEQFMSDEDADEEGDEDA
jgi:hypothetical protein